MISVDHQTDHKLTGMKALADQRMAHQAFMGSLIIGTDIMVSHKSFDNVQNILIFLYT